MGVGWAVMLALAAAVVLWHKAYPEMYVQPSRLLGDIAAESAT